MLSLSPSLASHSKAKRQRVIPITFTILPNDTLCSINQFLVVSEHFRLATTCRHLNDVCMDPSASPVTVTLHSEEDLKRESKTTLPTTFLRLRPTTCIIDESVTINHERLELLCSMSSLTSLTMHVHNPVTSLASLSLLLALNTLGGDIPASLMSQVPRHILNVNVSLTLNDDDWKAFTTQHT